MNNTNNVLGEPLELCSCKPNTGYFRDGCCRTAGSDLSPTHYLCRHDRRLPRLHQGPW
nr:DUF2237 family protein [Photobacterium leiognathi]